MRIFWKIVKYGILTIFSVLILLVVYISIIFYNSSFSKNFSSSLDYTSYFPENYEKAREEFKNLSLEIETKYQAAEYFTFEVPSKVDSDLTVGICYIPAKTDSSRLIIMSSGLHGIEGYAGHAIQKFFIENYLNDELLEQTGILFIHSINPFGFKYYRKVTENNVDLNRNSSVTDSVYSTVNQAYPVVKDFLLQQKEVNFSSLENRFFFLKAINEIRKASIPLLRQAALQGQYQDPQGIYYGGKMPEPQIDSLKTIIPGICEPYSIILAADLHTGYGERGKLHLFESPVDSIKKEKMEQLYQGLQIDWGDSDDFYTYTGDFMSFLEELNHGKEFYPFTLEYGTLNSQTRLGSLRSIQAMRLENQGRQYGFSSYEDSLETMHLFKELYIPGSVNWRNQIVAQTKEVFDIVIPRFCSIKNN